MKLIGIAGVARSGKTSVADYLAHYHGYHQIAFADSIRDFIRDHLGVHSKFLDYNKEAEIPEYGVSYRHLAQTLGDWGRGLNPEFWIIALQKYLWTYAGPTDAVVIADVRYLNEARFVRTHGQLWHIRRPGIDAAATRRHSSEQGIINHPGEPVIINGGSLEDLYQWVDDLMESVKRTELRL